jgi:two-component system, NtrC family, nitrogen regulation sensor histidine kinase NtrY
MTTSGRIQRRLQAAIVLTALIPLMGAIYLAEKAVRDTSARYYTPEIGARLDQSLDLSKELARATKAVMRTEATAIAERPKLTAAVEARDLAAIARELQAAVARQADLVSLRVMDGDRELGSADRGRPVDDAKELTLEVHRALGARAADESPDAEPEGGVELIAVFATDRKQMDDLDRMRDGMSKFVDQYNVVATRRPGAERATLLAFAALLGMTIIAAIAVGTMLARSVSRRITNLADATRKVGAGDLTTRVEETGSDEVSDLASAFNRMLGEVESSRARIEFLQRIGAWQEMARRLAHEIKNPLTPIQLAVEEIHQRYSGSDQSYRKLLDATLEVVEAEVGTLRRLVGEFSGFARLPEAHLESGDLGKFLNDQRDQIGLLEEELASGTGKSARVAVTFEVPPEPAPALLDRQMLWRAIFNLIRNSAQAIRDQGRADGNVRVKLGRSNDFWLIDVDDDGPGIAPELGDRIFDPYVTTKEDGTGLGLAIVKKIVVEHGGSISALGGDLGGARFRLAIPVEGTVAANAAREREAGSTRSPENIALAVRTSPP